MRLYTQLLHPQQLLPPGPEHIRPRGVMVHSTGANNPWLRRYLAPDDGRLGEPSPRHWNQGGVGACVHAMIGKAADGSVAVYQTLPWTMRGWHCGRSGNDTHISFEICEDSLTDKGLFSGHVSGCRRADGLPVSAVQPGPPGRRGGAVPQRGLSAGHCVQPRRRDALVAQVRRGHGRFSGRMWRRQMKGGERDLTEQEVRSIVREELAAAQAERDKLPRQRLGGRDGLKQAKAAGITDGTRPRGWATREEVALMVAAGKK